MSSDLQLFRDTAPTNAAIMRGYAVFLDAQRSDRRVQKPRSVAELLDRKQKPSRNGGLVAQLIDIKA